MRPSLGWIVRESGDVGVSQPNSHGCTILHRETIYKKSAGRCLCWNTHQLQPGRRLIRASELRQEEINSPTVRGSTAEPRVESMIPIRVGQQLPFRRSVLSKRGGAGKQICPDFPWSDHRFEEIGSGIVRRPWPPLHNSPLLFYFRQESAFLPRAGANEVGELDWHYAL
ncbi:hypothetical protein R1flu_025296 [Riccia fluitans]|uniref:Uncharacterized protein n=1 Tax=Riccia fluitans TaxID=41844 RepID=A0ABD1XXS1_9MARC